MVHRLLKSSIVTSGHDGSSCFSKKANRVSARIAEQDSIEQQRRPTHKLGRSKWRATVKMKAKFRARLNKARLETGSAYVLMISHQASVLLI